MTTSSRYRFGEFVLSPRQRVLWRGGAPVALIPKYFDLLHLLIRRRQEAVSKQAIFTEVWSDVIVSDGALSQAIRILRRTLDDDAREPRFIRTVPRHGYQFVWGALDEAASERSHAALKRALVTVALTRTLYGVIAVAQGTRRRSSICSSST